MKFKRNVHMVTCTYAAVLHIIIISWIVIQVYCADYLESGTNGDSYSKLRDYVHTNKFNFDFTKRVYNVTIPENSIGKTYATPQSYDDRIGLEILNSCNVVFRIISGDRDKLFKAEERTVGNFAFLAIRTRTSNVVLNREKNEEYYLRIKAIISCPEKIDNNTKEKECIVNLKVLDRNDLSPLFYPTEYSATISEDVTIHKSILKVTAEDADLGQNGEIYYSFLNSNGYFAIHPTTGVISNVSPLTKLGGTTVEITVLAVDRGSAMLHYSHQSSKAKVVINVEKVSIPTQYSVIK